MPLVLASASPRRREILAQLGLVFEVESADVDESPSPSETPAAYVRRLAEDKARTVANRRGVGAVLGADTVVCVGDALLTKPIDDQDATRMLGLLSGREHSVLTGVFVIAEGLAAGVVAETRVWFRPLTPETIAAYVERGEGRDKAGSYAIQGLGAGLVERIEGSYHNVVGLPAAESLRLLAKVGALSSWP
ncbi:MAG: Maf family protein [Myxococcota bacterium]